MHSRQKGIKSEALDWLYYRARFAIAAQEFAADGSRAGSAAACAGLMQNLVSLELQGNSLQGSFPAELAAMPALKLLDLTNNALGGQLPADWSGSPWLTLLMLSGNLLTGARTCLGSPDASEASMQKLPSDCARPSWSCGAVLAGSVWWSLKQRMAKMSTILRSNCWSRDGPCMLRPGSFFL
jgi:hypothetical protein